MSAHRKPSSRNIVRRIVIQLEKVYDAFHRFLARITGRMGKPMAAEIYYAVQHSKGVEIKGRVLLSRKWRKPSLKDSRTRNFFQMAKRWATPERPFSLVRISAGGTAIEQRADREGYFDIEIPGEQVSEAEILIELPESEVSAPTQHDIRKPGKHSRVLIVSDIDDTVLVTNVGKTLHMIATTIFGNALTRQLFPGTTALYRALRNGITKDSEEKNPIAYVTSSPFNLHGLLYLIFKENKLPMGAFFMNDWGVEIEHWISRSHFDHKTDSIEQALAWYPQKPVILLGDSSQHDTMIYIEVALNHPGRIDQILIRDVSGPDRIEILQETVEKLHDSGTEFAFFEHSTEAAEILFARNWITDKQRAHVYDATKEDEKSILQQVSEEVSERIEDVKSHRNG